jgi:peptidoglycan-N-acetylglucosamine deacetylase
MWRAGIGWSADGYECAIIDGAGVPAAQHTRFPRSGLIDLVAFLRDAHEQAGGDLVTVIDSTNGLVDGSLLTAGLVVYRADPQALPTRPALGSVDAGVLVRVPPSDLTRLSLETGTMSGRYPETVAGWVASVDVERRLADEGRFSRHGPRRRPEVAITFDDGPDPRYTAAILDILRDHQAPATFFCVGMNAAAHPDLVARAADEGHELANHTWSHAFLPDLTRAEVLRQIDETNAAIARVTGRQPTLMRPPYGARTPAALEWLAEHGMTMVTWDVDGGDWARPGPDAIARATVEVAEAGSVVLMHDAGGDRSQTVAALPALLAGLQDRGLRPVPLERVLGLAA